MTFTIEDDVPSNTTILVIGGGPGGSYASSLLAREGFQVVLLEADKFPRYHIGESMLPSLRSFLRLSGCEDKVAEYGFTQKPGAAMKFTQHQREGCMDHLMSLKGYYNVPIDTEFLSWTGRNGTWNVIRSEFDDILLKHAASSGVKVFEETKVTSINFDNHRPCSAEYVGPSGEIGLIHFDYLVDASGRNGVMSRKYLRNRQMNSSLKNVACWAYWRNGGIYMPGTSRQNAPYFQALTDETGWAWYIPLHDGTTSVGVVMDAMVSASKKAEASAASAGSSTLTDHYLEQLQTFAPEVFKLLKDATMITSPGKVPPVKSASDFSYAASSYAGDNFRLVGDAAAFIDPFFSSGVHLALTGGLSAAASIASSIRGEVTESEAVKYHDTKIGKSYTRFLLVVMSAYKQIRSQSAPVLADVDEDNFDRAFDIFRPVIQGSADAGRKLTEDELQKTMDFCKHVFAPTDQQMAEAVGARLDPSLFSPDAPIMTPDQIDALISADDEDARYVLKKFHARKTMGAEFAGSVNLELEEIAGYKINCVRGSLGLVKA